MMLTYFSVDLWYEDELSYVCFLAFLAPFFKGMAYWENRKEKRKELREEKREKKSTNIKDFIEIIHLIMLVIAIIFVAFKMHP